MEDSDKYIPLGTSTLDPVIEVGLLGVKVLQRNFEQNYVASLRMAEIERRILRIEKAFEITGLDINSIPFTD